MDHSARPSAPAPEVSLIAAVAENGVIGRDGGLPWRLSSDLRRFKRLTMGHHLLMGRRTFKSLGRPLRGRRLVVITRGRLELPEGVAAAASPEAAIGLARDAGETEVFVAGGAEIYRATLDRADRLYLTRVLAQVPGDTFFPLFPRPGWRRLSAEEVAADARNEHPTRFEVWERRHP